jgi:hypothetical protein
VGGGESERLQCAARRERDYRNKEEIKRFRAKSLKMILLREQRNPEEVFHPKIVNVMN